MLPEVPEHELIRRVQEGNHAACEILYHRYERPAYHLCMRVCVSGGKGEGPPRESLLQLYRRIDTFRPNLPQPGWLRRVALKLLGGRGDSPRPPANCLWAQFHPWTVKRRTVLVRTW